MPFNEVTDKKNHQVNCVIGGFAPGISEETRRLTTILLCNILGGPSSNSILDSILREKHGWVYNVECAYTPYSDCGIATIMFGCDKENLESCEKVIAKEIAKLQAKPLSASRLKSAKRQLLGQNAIGMESGEAQCLSMGKSILSFGRIASDDELTEKVNAITAEMIREMACEVFAEENMNRMVYL